MGNFFSTKNEFECIEEGIKSFNISVNMFLSRFKVCNPSTRVKLFQQYCMSLYGSQLWPLGHRRIMNLCTKWNMALRRVLGIPYRTHNDRLPMIPLHMPIEVSLHCRSQLWPLWHRRVMSLRTKWNMALRRVLCIPYRNRNYILPMIALHMPIEV